MSDNIRQEILHFVIGNSSECIARSWAHDVKKLREYGARISELTAANDELAILTARQGERIAELENFLVASRKQSSNNANAHSAERAAHLATRRALVDADTLLRRSAPLLNHKDLLDTHKSAFEAARAEVAKADAGKESVQ